jgi:hypothetical protein
MKEILVNIDELVDMVNELDSLLEEGKRIRWIEASYVTEDNSNLQQVAEIRAMEMSDSKETWYFERFLWVSKKPYRFGIALFYKI